MKHGTDNSRIKTINDDMQFNSLLNALTNVLGFTSEELFSIWKIIAAILHIGNIGLDGTAYNERNSNLYLL